MSFARLMLRYWNGLGTPFKFTIIDLKSYIVCHYIKNIHITGLYNWKNQFYFEFLRVLSYNEQQTLSYHWEDSYGVNSSYEL